MDRKGEMNWLCQGIGAVQEGETKTGVISTKTTVGYYIPHYQKPFSF